MKVTKVDQPATREVVVKTTKNNMPLNQGYKWWHAGSKKDLAQQLVATAGFLKVNQGYRYQQAAMLATLYGNKPLTGYTGSNINKLPVGRNNLPSDRPTMNVIQSCIDTLVSRVTQSKPKPLFLTDNGDYKQRNLAKKMNNFIGGELYQTKAYELSEFMLRDASIWGTGMLKIIETDDMRVGLERTLSIDLLTDPNDSFTYSATTQIYQLKLVDRDVAMERFPKYAAMIEKAENGWVDQSGDSSSSIADQIILAEGWHLPSGKKSKDGMHAIACTNGLVFDEDWEKEEFPFVSLYSSPPIAGYWGQGTAERLSGTQREINKMLGVASRAINLSAVPRVWVEDSGKVPKAHINNEIGMIGTFRGQPPIFMTGTTGLSMDYYEHLQRLIQYAYQQEGISALSAQAQKPAGLNSGEAIRNYDDLQSDRFAALVRRYENVFIDLAYQIIDKAKEIAIREGKYQTVYPDKHGAKEINFPDVKLLDDPFVIQCYDTSSLPKDPAGRQQRLSEWAQAGIITLKEYRRLTGFPDLEQEDMLANAAEERILQILDECIESGKDPVADPDMDLQLALQTTVQYINLYSSAKLEESKLQKLRDFKTQVQTIIQSTQPPPMPAPAAANPQALPAPRPTSDVLPNTPQ